MFPDPTTVLHLLLLLLCTRSLAYDAPAACSGNDGTCAPAAGGTTVDGELGTLPWLTHPVPADVWLTQYFERQPVYLSRKNVSYHGALAHAWDSVNGNIGYRARTGKFMPARATKLGVDVQPFQYWRTPEVAKASTAQEIKAGRAAADKSAPWDPDALLHLHREGFTLQYPAVEGHSQKAENKDRISRKKEKTNKNKHGDEEYRVDMPLRLRDFASMLTKTLGAYTTLNLYVTPPQQQGFKSHFDSHDVYVLQIRGKKRWQVYAEPLVAHPVSDWGEKKLSKARPSLAKRGIMIDVVLQPGDAMFIPRGFVHVADCLDSNLDSVSVHITVAINSVKVADAVFLAAKIGLSRTTGSNGALRRLKHALRERAASDELFRRSATPLCGGSVAEPEMSCETPTAVLVAAFQTAVEDVFAADEDTLLREALSHTGSEHLQNALHWARKKMRAGMKIPRGFSLRKIQPITHAMHEYRPPVRLM